MDREGDGGVAPHEARGQFSSVEQTVVEVVALARDAAPKCGSVRVIAVDGPSGSGKTVLGQAVAAELGCPLVQMDELFEGWDGLAGAPGRVTDQVLAPLAAGEQAAYRRWDWHRRHWADLVPVPASELLVIEGCGSSVSPAGGYAAVRVWVEASTEVRMARGLERDGEMYRPHWERWARQEAEVFALDRTRERADLLVVTG